MLSTFSMRVSGLESNPKQAFTGSLVAYQRQTRATVAWSKLAAASTLRPAVRARPIPANVTSTKQSLHKIGVPVIAKASDRETYDVFVNEPQYLQEGVRKHVLSVFVADEAGRR
jgi:hypothetical protein